MVDVREYNPRTQPGSEGSSTRTTLTFSLFREKREVLWRHLHATEGRKLRFKAAAEPVRDQEKADIIRGDFYIGVDNEKSIYGVCSSHEAVLSTRRNPAHPVSFLIPHPTTTYRLAGDTCVVYYQNVIILYVRVIRVRYDKCYQVYE